MSAVIETGDAPLELEQLTQLRSAAAGKTRAERGRLIPGVGREGMAQALAGLPVRPATRALIRLGLERLAAKAMTTFNRASVPGDETRKPACPRCLGLTPGTPASGPETPHPGPFAEKLCSACAKAVKPCCDGSLGPAAGYCREHNPGGRVE